MQKFSLKGIIGEAEVCEIFCKKDTSFLYSFFPFKEFLKIED